MEMRKIVLVTAMLIILASIMSAYVYAQSPSEIEIRNFPFLRDALTVPFGTEVIWINDDTIDHTVTCDDGSFHSGNLAPGERFRYRFDRPGNYRYHCEIHPSEQGMIQVTSKPYTELFTSSKTSSSTDADKKEKIQSKEYTKAQSKTQDAGSWAFGDEQKALASDATAHITIPEKCTICELESGAQSNLANLHVQDQGQKGEKFQYSAHATQSGKNALWIKGDTNWTKYTTVPQGSQLSLIAIASKEGSGYLYEKYPDGKTEEDEYYFFPYSQLSFYADTVGRHVLSFLIDDQASNSVVVDVVDYSTYNVPSYQQSYQQQSYQQQSSQQPSYQQPGYQQPSYVQQDYSQPSYNAPVSQPQLVPPATGPSVQYTSFWDTSAIKMDASGRLVLEGIQGTDYDLQPSNANVLTRGVSYNGVAYILVANPYGVPNTIYVNPQMANWRMQNAEVRYGELTLAQSGNLLQITAPAYQSGLIIIQPQKKRYSFTVGPKPPSSFRAGSKQVYSSTGGVRQPYSFSAGPKPPYSFRIGY